MADLGLLMSDAMAQACHEGRKTVTRRPMSPQPEHHWEHAPGGRMSWLEVVASTGPMWRPVWYMQSSLGEIHDYSDPLRPARIPGAGIVTVGRRVWIREAFNQHYFGFRRSAYRAMWDGSAADVVQEPQWTPSIHMPKWAARTWGRVTSVRPCDLSTVDDAEARLEGFETADDLLAALWGLYPDARWFWRVAIEWDAR